ncbi:MAG: threonine-phosphate decarboxylase CobD [Nitrospirota bacterium]|jgi:threonine-phosphate decarboxylase
MEHVAGSHGGDVFGMARALGTGPEDIVDFSASVNPLGVPESVLAVLREALDGTLLTHYPDPEATPLTEAFARRYGLEPQSILTGNGSTELISLLPRALRPKTVIVPSPTFSEYRRASRLVGAEVRHVVLRREEGFRLGIEDFIRALPGAQMAFLCNPNNPTGEVLPRADVLALAHAARSHGCMLVVDEAFMDFCPEHSVLGVESSHLVVLRSLTKFFALPGLRVGLSVLPPGVREKVSREKDPWSVNALAIRAGAAALEDEDYRARTLAFMAKEKAFLEARFGELGIGYIPSAANYYALEVGDAAFVREQLLRRRLAVRDCTNFEAMGRGYIRVAVRTRRENEMLLRELARLRERAWRSS